ncbi:MAG: YcgN family cysteine cluster protein [Pseudomonadota bacterium]
MADRYWETKKLHEMSEAEWEALCDGCGRCCAVLLRDEDTGRLFETDVACRLFDPKARRCTNYAQRLSLVKDCVNLEPETIGTLNWMPETCAYRLLANGEGLPAWHPLLTGDRESVRRAGVAVPPTLFDETKIDPEDLEDHIVRERSVTAR